MKFFEILKCARPNMLKHASKSNEYMTKIGLEIHARIAARTKIFSDANLSKIHGTFSNSQVSYYDAALPGTMPTLNKQCVEVALRAAHYLNCKTNLISLFERKHYFYPDLPNGYQITQQSNPIAFNGHLEYPLKEKQNTIVIKSARVNRIQLEHDSGRTLAFEKNNLIDLNRCGIGLMEIVTEPDFTSSKETSAFVIELASILKSIGACDVDMQEGGFRVDVNVSIHGVDSVDKLLPSPRVEIKNLNTFKAVEDAIECEVSRQRELKQTQVAIKQETRYFDMESNRTILLREKEDNHDYRFMPEPNLPPIVVKTNTPNQSNLVVNDINLYNSLVRKIPLEMIVDYDSIKFDFILPQQRRNHLIANLNQTPHDAYTLVNNDLDLMLEKLLDLNFKSNEKVDSASVQFYSKILLNEYQTVLNANPLNKDLITLNKLNDYCNLLRTNRISKRLGRKVFDLMLLPENHAKTPLELVTEHNLFLINDKDIIQKSIERVFTLNQEWLDTYQKKSKKRSSIYNLMFTQIQKDLNECANNLVLDELLKKALENLVH